MIEVATAVECQISKLSLKLMNHFLMMIIEYD